MRGKPRRGAPVEGGLAARLHGTGCRHAEGQCVSDGMPHSDAPMEFPHRCVRRASTGRCNAGPGGTRPPRGAVQRDTATV
eukprot:10516061-Alexandrium_andersonii.AAC.1